MAIFMPSGAGSNTTFVIQMNEDDRARIFLDGERVRPDFAEVLTDGAVILRWDRPAIRIEGQQ
jgi:hypothetical protein